MDLYHRGENLRLVEITAKLPNLIELSFNSFNHVNADLIIQLIESHRKPSKIDQIQIFTKSIHRR